MSTVPIDARPARGKREAWFPMEALSNALLLAGIVSAIFIVATLVGFGGWHYYSAPLASRGYLPAHRVLRPSGSVGQFFGFAGTLVMLGTLVYVLRKKMKSLKKFGTQKTWLEAHIFCGLVGPVLITLHTSFKFNGIISVAYWSMILVVASGFVGRYLYVRVPKTIRGNEVSLAELTARAADLKEELAASDLPATVLTRISEFERETLPRSGSSGWGGILAGDARLKRQLHALRRAISHSGADPKQLEEILGLIGERAVLLRRIAYLSQTKKLFALWHVFHKPLVYVMFAIAAVHIALAVYMGYSLVRF